MLTVARFEGQKKMENRGTKSDSYEHRKHKHFALITIINITATLSIVIDIKDRYFYSMKDENYLRSN